MTFGLLIFLILGVRLSDSYIDTAFRFSDIGSPTFGLLVFQIDWESDIRTPSFQGIFQRATDDNLCSCKM